MIKNFKCKETGNVFKKHYSRKFGRILSKAIMRKLWMLDYALSIRDLKVFPSNHLEKLHGKRKGQYSIRVNKQWRVCFEWSKRNAYNVEVADYHQ